MTRKQAEDLHRKAESERAWYRDHAEELWLRDYERRHPRPSDAVNVTQPGA